MAPSKDPKLVRHELKVNVWVPPGTDARHFLEDVIDIGWDCLHDRGGDNGWRDAHPTVFDGSPDRVVINRFQFFVGDPE